MGEIGDVASSKIVLSARHPVECLRVVLIGLITALNQLGPSARLVRPDHTGIVIGKTLWYIVILLKVKTHSASISYPSCLPGFVPAVA